MPSRFPFLKSKTDPYGLIEQFGIAVTIDAESDPSETAGRSWFGTTLFNGVEEAKDAKDVFVMTYMGDDGKKDTVATHKAITEAYAAGKLLYTAYDWKLTLLKIDPATNTGVVEGTVSLKGRCDLFVNNPKKHKGAHSFRYVIAIGSGNNWRIKEWELVKEKKTPGVINPRIEFLLREI